jgi:hypothetical protein
MHAFFDLFVHSVLKPCGSCLRLLLIMNTRFEGCVLV